MKQRYITRGVAASLPIWLQATLWELRDCMQPDHRDYLQIFQLTALPGLQKIVHKQEQPPYEHELDFAAEDGVTQKVYIIDDGTYVTMLLAEEY